MNFEEQLQERVSCIEKILEDTLPKQEGFQKTVLDAMDYSVMVGGKRLRPMLMLEAYRMFAGTEAPTAPIEPLMAAMEMLHTYSLVHDDLPAMDNDEYRRGKKTTWVAYGEAMAILAGDALLNFAYETALSAAGQPGADPLRVLKACRIFAHKAGVYGMIGGQVVDVEAEKAEHTLSEEELTFVYECKTSALIEASLMMGAVMAGAGEEDIKAMELVGHQVGIAFQIQDDILDLTSTLEVLGKPIGSDEKNHKQTYVHIHGMEQAKADVERMSAEALALLQGRKKRNEFLEQLVNWLITREK